MLLVWLELSSLLRGGNVALSLSQADEFSGNQGSMLFKQLRLHKRTHMCKTDLEIQTP